MTPQQLIDAYSQGFFPWPQGDEPISWYNPDPRFVLKFSDFHLSASLEKAIQKKPYEIRVDTCFCDVILACAESKRPEQDGTWIRQDVIKAYTQLHTQGFAHSIEAFLDNKLVGGLYGVSLGGVFFGESMFAKAPNASKVAFVYLVKQLKKWDFDFIDCQAYTKHLARFGATFWPRKVFLESLKRSLKKPTLKGPWRFEPV
ncbi:MAG: leucyl/phenylalanyl-tRNA--protein transferase [Deltaproteobacteria bacterium]|nr:leucyl/phenylalanyl-tRNA--protein transferase [Deltaproteobacteria bacterium]